MFRNGKFSEATPAKQSRSERFQEMSKQQQLIEQKKREIQARFEEKKKKTVELIEENKSQKPIAITKNAIKLDKIKSFYQKSKSIKKNEALTKNIKEEFPYESTGAHKIKPNVKDVFEKEDVIDPINTEKDTEPKAEHVVKLESNYCQEAYKEPKSFIPDHQFIGYINQSYQQPNYYNSPSVQVTSIQSQPQTTVVQVPTVSIVTTHPILQISQPTSMYQPQNPVFLSQNNSKINIPHGTYQQYPLQTPPLTATIVTDTTTTTTVPRNADEQPSLIVTETSTVSLGPTPDAAHLLNAPPQTIETYTPVPRALNTVMRCEPQAVLENQDVESLAATVAEYGDEIENIILQERPQDINLLFLRDKTSPAYTIFRQRVGYLKAKMIAHKLTPTDIKSQTLFNRVSVADSENEDVANKKRKRKSRWANDNVKVPVVSPIDVIQPVIAGQTIPQPINDHKLVGIPGMSGPMISQIGRNDPALVQYAMQSFGTLNLSEEDWKKAEDHYKINLLYQDMLKKRQQLENLHKAGKFKYEYDSDEDTEGGTWEHKLRKDEMVATERWAEELTEKSKDKHHIGDFLPPDELARFMEKYSALKEDREPDLSDYKEFKLKEDNIGFQMLQKLGWSEGQGLGSGGTGIVEPVNKGGSHNENHGLGVERPSELRQNDDEFDAYRKRMMLAYRFRPNPLNNPRRPYY